MAQTFDTIEKYPGLSMEEARQRAGQRRDDITVAVLRLDRR